jgi:2-aminoethylphosphonate-pyruvate transaminase
VIEDELKAHPEIEIVAAVHHETTTGLLNPVGGIGQLARRFGKKLLVDGISSLAGDTVDCERYGIDFCVGTANKCIQGLPGVSFVFFRKSDSERLERIPARNVYLNLMGNWRAQEQGGTPFTPAVQIHYAFDEALSELEEETVAGRIARYSRAAARLRAGFKAMGLEFLLPETHCSNTLTSLRMPPGIAYPLLHDRLRARGYVIYAGQGNFNNAIFRVANMGDIATAEFDRFLADLKASLAPA